MSDWNSPGDPAGRPDPTSEPTRPVPAPPQPAQPTQPAQPVQPQGWNTQPPWGPPPPTGGPGRPDLMGGSNAAGKGFFGALFDFGFTSFVTPTIVKVVYILATILIGLGYLILLVSSLRSGALSVIVTLIAGGLGALVYLALVRISLEFMYAIVRMSEDINRRLPKA